MTDRCSMSKEDGVIGCLTKEPITRTTLALFAGASADHNPMHIDIDFAKEAGMPDVFAHGMLSMAYLGQLVTGWRPQAQLKRFKVRFRSITYVGESIVCTGTVIETKRDEKGEIAILKLVAANKLGEIKLDGEAEVRW